MKIFLLASVAALFPVAFMETCETVTVKGADGKPLRINRADYDADQAEGGAKEYTLHKEDAGQSVAGSNETRWPQGVDPVAAPSAPNFNPAPGEGSPPLIDPTKGAAAPSAPSPGQRLVVKEGTGKAAAWYVTDAQKNKLTDTPGIDPNGYPNEQEAWAAALANPQPAP